MAVLNVSITTGGTAEVPALLVEDHSRLSVRIKPTTEDLWVNFGATAAVDTGILISSGSVEFFNADEYPDIKKYVSLRSATSAAKINILIGAR